MQEKQPPSRPLRPLYYLNSNLSRLPPLPELAEAHCSRPFSALAVTAAPSSRHPSLQGQVRGVHLFTCFSGVCYYRARG